MTRHFATRVLRALLAVWFVLSVGEPSVLRICPMHASAAAELADARFDRLSLPDRGEHAGHSTAGHHGGHGASSHSHSSGQHEHQHHHHCTCISSCVGSASSVLAARGVQLETPPLVVGVARTTSSGDLHAVEDPPYLLPPGTGPPRV